MYRAQTTPERALDLARSGECAGILDIKVRLCAEGRAGGEAQVFSLAFGSKLRSLCHQAQANRPPRT